MRRPCFLCFTLPTQLKFYGCETLGILWLSPVSAHVAIVSIISGKFMPPARSRHTAPHALPTRLTACCPGMSLWTHHAVVL